jgi:hypothetical protein
MQKHRKTPLEKIEFKADSCSTDSRLKILHVLPFFKNLSHEAINDINTIFRDYHYSAGEMICFSGDKSTKLCVVAEGSIKLVKHSVEGHDGLLIQLQKVICYISPEFKT